MITHKATTGFKFASVLILAILLARNTFVHAGGGHQLDLSEKTAASPISIYVDLDENRRHLKKGSKKTNKKKATKKSKKSSKKRPGEKRRSTEDLICTKHNTHHTCALHQLSQLSQLRQLRHPYLPRLTQLRIW
jgi:hypothetical protein